VEAILLFSAVIVNLCGIMYASVERTALAAAAQPQLTVIIILVVVVSMAYYFVVLVGEITLQCRARKERKAMQKGTNIKAAAGAGGATGAGTGGLTSADVKKAAFEQVRGAAGRGRVAHVHRCSTSTSAPSHLCPQAKGIRRGSTKLAVNPMFVQRPGAAGGGEDEADGGVRAAIITRVEPPDAAMWMVFKQQYSDMSSEATNLQKELAVLKAQVQRNQMTAAAGATSNPAAALRRVPSARPGAGPARNKTSYKPTIAGGPDAGGGVGTLRAGSRRDASGGKDPEDDDAGEEGAAPRRAGGVFRRFSNMLGLGGGGAATAKPLVYEGGDEEDGAGGGDHEALPVEAPAPAAARSPMRASATPRASLAPGGGGGGGAPLLTSSRKSLGPAEMAAINPIRTSSRGSMAVSPGGGAMDPAAAALAATASFRAVSKRMSMSPGGGGGGGL
jgi:hypothetical protein